MAEAAQSGGDQAPKSPLSVSIPLHTRAALFRIRIMCPLELAAGSQEPRDAADPH
jgi:hypothetical protein